MGKNVAPQENDASSPVQIMVAKYGLAAAVITGIFGLIGAGLVAYFGYVGDQMQVRIPIDATTTAESRSGTQTPVSVASTATYPPIDVRLSPYQDSFLELILATPSLDQTLKAAEDTPYSYTVRYFIPEFDWEGSGIEPRIQLERVVNAGNGLHVVALNDYAAEIGKATTIDISGRFIVPSDRDTWALRIKILFRAKSGDGVSGGNILIPFEYSIAESP